MAQSQSAFAQLDVGGTKVCFVRIKDMTKHSLVDGSTDAICGSLFHDKNRVDEGIIVPKLQILLQPTPEELDVLLPWMGFAESPTDTFTMDTDITNMATALVLDRVATVDDLGNAYVDKWILRGSKGTHPLSLELHVFCDAAPGISGTTFTGSAPGTLTAPYPFHRGVLTLEGGTKEFDSFMLVGNNNIAMQHNNSQEPSTFEYGGEGKTIHLGVSTPYTSSETVLLTNPIAGVAGAAGSLVFTRGGQSTTWSLTNLKSEVTPPDIPGKAEDPLQSEIRLKTFYKSYASGATNPLVVTHDATA